MAHKAIRDMGRNATSAAADSQQPRERSSGKRWEWINSSLGPAVAVLVYGGIWWSSAHYEWSWFHFPFLFFSFVAGGLGYACSYAKEKWQWLTLLLAAAALLFLLMAFIAMPVKGWWQDARVERAEDSAPPRKEQILGYQSFNVTPGKWTLVGQVFPGEKIYYKSPDWIKMLVGTKEIGPYKPTQNSRGRYVYGDLGFIPQAGVRVCFKTDKYAAKVGVKIE